MPLQNRKVCFGGYRVVPDVTGIDVTVAAAATPQIIGSTTLITALSPGIPSEGVDTTVLSATPKITIKTPGTYRVHFDAIVIGTNAGVVETSVFKTPVSTGTAAEISDSVSRVTMPATAVDTSVAKDFYVDLAEGDTLAVYADVGTNGHHNITKALNFFAELVRYTF